MPPVRGSAPFAPGEQSGETDSPVIGRRSHGTDVVDEPTLVRRVQRGDESAFGVLVERYVDSGYVAAMAVLGNPHDAEDAVQNAFIRALERIEQLQPGSPFGPWFYRVLRSTALNLRRREVLRSHDEIPASASMGSNPATVLDRGLTRDLVLGALAELPEMQRMAVTLYDLEGYSHQEIAGILGIAVGTSRAHVHHGRKALRNRLGEQSLPSNEEERKDEASR
jgi:RNA polymerase sigma-70 factor (ECF subfamily)